MKSNNPNQWKKGQSGNPAGTPKGLFSIAKELKKQMGDVDPKDAEGRTHGAVMVAKAIWLANYGSNGQGSIKAVSEVFDRLIGRPAQAVTLDATVTDKSASEHVTSILRSLETLQAAKDSDERVQ